MKLFVLAWNYTWWFSMPDRDPGVLEYICFVGFAGALLSALVIGIRRRVMRDRWLRGHGIDPDRPTGEGKRISSRDVDLYLGDPSFAGDEPSESLGDSDSST